MMVTPSGSRVELRQIGGSSLYESQDGSYTQLDDTNSNALTVRTTDGTRFTFVPVTVNNEYRCVEVKDRNGNFISATYNTTNGHLQTVTDTLGRVVTLVYDGNSNLIAIRQTWAGVTHDWATFAYGQVWVAPNFGGGLVVNGPNNNYVTVLTQVSLHDGSYFTFDYNSAFGQVNRINHYAADAHLLSYTSYNVDFSAGQTDCPRFTERRDWAEYGVMNQSQELLTGYSVAADGSWSQQTTPDGTVYKEFFATTGWQNGLTTTKEVWSGGVKKKWTTIGWTQDDTNLGYQNGPRPVETNTYDDNNNRQRTTISYSSVTVGSTVCHLPETVRQYGGPNFDQVLRRTDTFYMWNTAMLDRRVIGLPWRHVVYEGESTLLSMEEYIYDWLNNVEATAPSVQHDTANYGASLGAARGIVVGIFRYNANDTSQGIWVRSFGYNLAGEIVWINDALNHRTTISYADSFSDGNNARNTLAYPTTITDPDGFSSTAQYNYDIGALTRTEDPKGAVQTLTYDSAARISQVTNAVNNAYIRWVYPSAMNYVQRFTTIQAGAGEAYSADFMDGWGKVRASASDHPGSTGGYKAVHVMYDAAGRTVQSSNPTEINSGWAPTGDDAAGWVWTNQSYDWKGRPTVTTFPDGSTRENIYGGCGCAGGEVTTVRDERGRRRKLTRDILGRLKQVDELNWDTSVYATTTYTYNARDQITQINQAGQIRTMAYDGHGRLQSRTTPEQGTTAYSYFADDATQTITDARGVTTTFAYNNRRLPASIAYNVSGDTTGQTAATANVSFGYDAAGNRTSMTDGLGSVSYAYDQLSRLTSETRTFSGVGSFAIGYGYNLAGELTGVTGPSQFGSISVGYNYDAVGRLTSVTGANYAGVTNYANNISYRAFGLKGMNYGNGKQLSINYDNKLRMTRWDVAGVLGSDYGYGWEDTFRPAFARSRTDATLDRWYAYDHVGRLHIGRSGSEARAAYGEPFNNQFDGPYSMGVFYDVWGNITYREGWGGWNRVESASYTNNRRNGMQYDAAGNLITDNYSTFTYDVNGQPSTTYHSALGVAINTAYDGDGLRAKKTVNGTTSYYLRSSVLGGQVVAEMDGSGSWTRGYVYNGGSLLAVQQNSTVYWMHEDPVTKSKRVTDGSGTVVSTIELDPWGGETTRSSNQAFQPKRFTTYERDADNWDEAGARNYHAWWSRFAQPDPYDGSYNPTDPQSFNRYAYVQNDPVNFVDPSGLQMNAEFCGAEHSFSACGGAGGFWGGSFGGHVAEYNREYGGLTPNIAAGMQLHNQRVQNDIGGYGFLTNEQVRKIFAAVYIFDPETGQMVKIADAVWSVDEPSTFRNFLAGVIDYGVGPPPIFGWSLGKGLRLGADTIAGSYADEQSAAYYVGSWVPDVVAVAAGGGAATQQGLAQKLVGPQSPLFRRGGKAAGGLLNKTDLIRIGWSWDQTAGRLSIAPNAMGRQVFRIAGNWPIHWHRNIWVGPASW